MDDHDLNPLKYPPNSKSQKTESEKPRLERIVSSEVKTQKKSIFKRFGSAIISESPDSIGGYIVKEVVVPYIKDIIFDTIMNATSMAMYGSPRNGRRSGGRVVSRNSDGYIQYGSYSSSGSSDRQQRVVEDKWNGRVNVDNIIFGMSSEAHEVLDALSERLEHYGSVTVQDLYDLIGVTTPKTAMYWGWTDISEACVRQTNEGWLLDLPKIKPLSR